MKHEATPVLDRRDAAGVLTELLARRPAYLPEWLPMPGQGGWALLHILARYAEVIVDRLNQAPDKNMLAFLDMLGISLIPAHPARAPVVFEPLPNAGNGRIPAGTRLGAQVTGRPEPLMFETEGAIAMAAARLVEVKTLWPARDEYADHTLDFAGGRPFELFKGRKPVPHEIYLAHDTLFAFAGRATVEIELELATTGSEPLEIAWEYWNGETWRPFKAFDASDEDASCDGTMALTRSGVITLRAECGAAKKTKVHGIEAYWVRGRLDQALPPDAARVLPEIDRVHLRSSVERPGTWMVFTSDEVADDEKALEVAVRYENGAPVQDLRLDILQEAAPDPNPLITSADGTCGLTSEALRTGTHNISISHERVPNMSFDVQFQGVPIHIEFVLTPGIQPEFAFANGMKLDVSKSFYPLGQSPQPGSTFYFSAEEIFNKPGAVMTVVLESEFMLEIDDTNCLMPTPRLLWEYWNGKQWLPLRIEPPIEDLDEWQIHPALFTGWEMNFEITVPLDIRPTTVCGEEALWMRVRLARGRYGYRRTVGSDPNTFEIDEIVPPVISVFRLGYSYRSPWETAEHCLAYSDFQFEVHSRDVRWPGNFFAPFKPVMDITPSLYLGFDQPLPNDLVSLYLDFHENETKMPPLVWESWDGKVWRELRFADETMDLGRPGMVSFLAPDVAARPQATVRQAADTEITAASALEAAVFTPGQQVTITKGEDVAFGTVEQVQEDLITLQAPLTKTYRDGTVQLAALPRFGTPRDWVRARLKFDGAPCMNAINGLYLNAAWARQVQTLNDAVLGSSRGQPKETFFFTQIPVLPGERIEVRELQGQRAHVELPMLRKALLQRGMSEDDVRAVTDPRTGRVREVWVRWKARDHLFFSDPEDRHYMIERARGRLIFGDGVNGLIPPPGANNILARRYQAGGGLDGNVAAGAIKQLLGSAPFVLGVGNPRAADGGAEGESLDEVYRHGPQTLRHRRRALSAQDYEGLAREASPGVAAVRVLPATAPNGRPAPGWVTVIIVPQSHEPQPQPSLELRDAVHAHLLARAPATLAAERLAVIGPTYLPIGVSAAVVPHDLGEAGAVKEAVRSALARFLHPLTGGPEGRGWPFGRAVYLSDVAALLESLGGVDHMEDLNLLLNDTPRGEWIAVPPDRIVVAGALRVEMKPPGA